MRACSAALLAALVMTACGATENEYLDLCEDVCWKVAGCTGGSGSVDGCVARCPGRYNDALGQGQSCVDAEVALFDCTMGLGCFYDLYEWCPQEMADLQIECGG